MSKKSITAAARTMGAAKSPAKTAAAKANGLKGGRPALPRCAECEGKPRRCEACRGKK